MATRFVPKTQLRDRIRSEIDDLGNDMLVVSESGQPVAVLVAVDRWNDLQGTLEDLEDAVALLDLRSSGEEGRPAEQVFAAIEAEEADAHRSAQ